MSTALAAKSARRGKPRALVFEMEPRQHRRQSASGLRPVLEGAGDEAKVGIAEDTAIELPNEEVERLIDAHVPASWRSLSPSEADAQWLREVQRKEKET